MWRYIQTDDMSQARNMILINANVFIQSCLSLKGKLLKKHNVTTFNVWCPSMCCKQGSSDFYNRLRCLLLIDIQSASLNSQWKLLSLSQKNSHWDSAKQKLVWIKHEQRLTPVRSVYVYIILTYKQKEMVK